MKTDTSRKLSVCRLCSGKFQDFRLRLEDSPLANELFESRESAQNADIFPLEVAICSECKGNQLTTIVSADRLFSNYSYDSGVSKEMTGALIECADYLSTIVSPGGRVLEIGSNDGTLMLHAQENIGLNIVGIEPSLRHVRACQERNLSVIHGLVSAESLSLATELAGGNFSLAVGNNVFAHIDNLREAFEDISNVLDENGYLVFEVSYFGKVVEDGLFDTIYHEHMSYHTVTSINNLMKLCNFTLIDVLEISAHGGSIRITARKGVHDQNPRISTILENEKKLGLDSSLGLEKLKIRIDTIRENSISYLKSRIDNSSSLWGYGAPAKAVTFITELKLQHFPWKSIIEDNPYKQGKYLPQSGIKLVKSTEFASNIQDAKPEKLTIVILPWNVKSEITRKVDALLKESGVSYEAVCLFPELMITSKGNEKQ